MNAGSDWPEQQELTDHYLAITYQLSAFPVYCRGQQERQAYDRISIRFSDDRPARVRRGRSVFLGDVADEWSQSCGNLIIPAVGGRLCRMVASSAGCVRGFAS